MLTDAIDSGMEVIVAVGGDGTINQCVHALAESERPADELPKLAVLPAGSGNDFARTAACPESVTDLVASILQASYRPIDIGRMTYADRTVSYFVNIAEVGLGTTVIARAEKMQRWVGNKLGYQMAILRTVASCPEFEAHVEGDDFSFRGRFSTIAIANAKYYGSGLGVAPTAVIDDGLLDVVLIRAFSPLDFLRYIRKLRRCETIQDSRIQTYQTARINIEGTAKCSMDGELGNRLPVQIDILPRRLNLIQHSDR